MRLEVNGDDLKFVNLMNREKVAYNKDYDRNIVPVLDDVG